MIIITSIDELSATLTNIVEKLIPPMMNEAPNKAQLITKSELAKHLKCSQGTIDNYRRQGRIRSHGFGRSVLFDLDEVISDLKDSTR